MEPHSQTFTRLSYRDPEGAVFRWNERLFRAVHRKAEWDYSTVSQLSALAPFLEKCHLPATWVLEPEEKARILAASSGNAAWDEEDVVLEHQPVWFPSYPSEWCPPMLYESADLTLSLAEVLCEEGYGLKDATPFNVLFDGVRPVFVDWLSFEKREATDPIWLAQAQFARNFLIPLLLHQKRSISPGLLFASRREGLSAEEAFPLLSPIQRMLPPARSLVTLPVWLGRTSSSQGIYHPIRYKNPERAQFVLGQTLRRHRRQLKRLRPHPSRVSPWSDYMGEDCPYGEAQWDEKNTFLKTCYQIARPKTVLDVGCNTGHFSELAARAGARVVGIDGDESSVSLAFERARKRSLDVQPLLVNLARPTPSQGWRNQEQRSFLDRVANQFDLVQALAVVHHLLVGEGVALPSLVELLSQLTRRWAVVEWVGPTDPSVIRLARGRSISHLSRTGFEEEVQRAFRVESRHQLQGMDRYLYRLARRSTAFS